MFGIGIHSTTMYVNRKSRKYTYNFANLFWILLKVFLKSQQTNVTESEYVLIEETMKERSSALIRSLETSIPGNNILFGEKNVEG